MNKAFVKESEDESDDDEAPEAQLPSGTRNYMTRRGHAALRAEFEHLVKVERPEIVKVVAWAAGNGDRSENGDYIYGKKRLREIDRRIRFLTKRLESAVVVDPAEQRNCDQVFSAATVTVCDADGIEATYQMVVTVTAIVLVTAIGGTLADRLVLTGDALVRSEVSRASLARLYEDVVRSIPVAIVTFDAAGRVDGANPMATQLLGLEGAQLLGEDVRAVLPFIDALGSVEGATAAGDATLETSSGAIPVSYHSAPLTDHTAAVRGGLVVVDDRSREERLRVAVEQAERFAVLGRLAAGLAHEIRNPLGAISGCVELVRETAALTPEERNLLVTAGRDVGRLNQLVTDMLQFARPRPAELMPTDLAALAREVVTMARTSDGPESNVELRVGGDASVVTMADGNQVRQVLWNLVRNAAQASRRGAAVEVEVRGAEHEAEIAVLDRGPGVAPELRGRLFDAFYSGTARGTGLGLAMVKRIADAHGGRVEVRDREGGGSVFSVVIPRDAAEIVDEVAVRQSERPKGA